MVTQSKLKLSVAISELTFNLFGINEENEETVKL